MVVDGESRNLRTSRGDLRADVPAAAPEAGAHWRTEPGAAGATAVDPSFPVKPTGPAGPGLLGHRGQHAPGPIRHRSPPFDLREGPWGPAESVWAYCQISGALTRPP